MEQKHIDFIRANKEMLKEIFTERIEEIKNNVFNPLIDEKKRDIDIRFVQEFMFWLAKIRVLENDTGEKQTNKIYK